MKKRYPHPNEETELSWSLTLVSHNSITIWERFEFIELNYFHFLITFSFSTKLSRSLGKKMKLRVKLKKSSKWCLISTSSKWRWTATKVWGILRDSFLPLFSIRSFIPCEEKFRRSNFYLTEKCKNHSYFEKWEIDAPTCPDELALIAALKQRIIMILLKWIRNAIKLW